MNFKIKDFRVNIVVDIIGVDSFKGFKEVSIEQVVGQNLLNLISTTFIIVVVSNFVKEVKMFIVWEVKSFIVWEVRKEIKIGAINY